MTQSINAHSLAPDARNWLANPCQPRILHIFDQACNLINERREVLSVVTPAIGNGPFNLVIEDDVLFSGYLNLESPISNYPNLLNLGDLTIHIQNAKLWSPRPDWEILHVRRDDVFAILSKLPVNDYESPGSQRSVQFSNSLASALVNADVPASVIAARELAGLGIGLTPAGDDFIMGAIYATWIIHPPEIAGVLAEKIANIAAPLTTSLSAAWLRSAGRGEAGILWHQFFDALLSADQVAIQESMDKIIVIGETSGADALFGFLSLLAAWAVEART